MEAHSDTSTERKRLIHGRLMRCPRCEESHDILQYVPMGIIEEYALETTPIYKCPACKWLFAPVDDVVLSVIKQRNGGVKLEVRA